MNNAQHYHNFKEGSKEASIYIHVHVREMKKEGRKKQARSNKQHVHLPIKTPELHVSKQECTEREEVNEVTHMHHYTSLTAVTTSVTTLTV